MFALLPGSRMGELEMHAELCCSTAAEIFDALPEARFVVPLVSREAREYFEGVQYRLHFEMLPMTLLYGHADDALQAADVGIVASGTATLEAAMSRCPHIIFYRVSAITAGIVMRQAAATLCRTARTCLPGASWSPEFLQDEATVANLSRAALNLYDDTVTRRRLEALFAQHGQSLSADTEALVADAVLTELRAAGVAC